MPHTRDDVIKAKNDYIAATDRLLAVLTGARSAFENSKRAVVMLIEDDKPLELTAEDTGKTKSFVRELADKIAATPTPGG